MSEMIETKDVFRTLKCNFTQKEKVLLGEQMAGCIREKNRLEDELGSIKKQYSGDIGKQDTEISSLAERLNTGWEMRRVECLEVKDFANGSVCIYRKEKGFFDGEFPDYLLVEERPMTGEERQMKLPIGEEVDGAPAGEKAKPGVEGAEATPEPLPKLVADAMASISIQADAQDNPDHPETPHESLQDEPGPLKTGQSMVGEGVISEELKAGIPETLEIIEKIIEKDLSTYDYPEDINPFYEGKEPEEPKKMSKSVQRRLKEQKQSK